LQVTAALSALLCGQNAASWAARGLGKARLGEGIVTGQGLEARNVFA
jgi:hypothetical protein